MWVASTWNSTWNFVHLERPLGIFQLGIWDLEFYNLEFLTLGMDLVGIFYLERINLEFFTLRMDLVGIFYLERINLEFLHLEFSTKLEFKRDQIYKHAENRPKPDSTRPAYFEIFTKESSNEL